LGFGVVLVGIKKPEQVEENTRAFGWHLAENDLDILDTVSAEKTEMELYESHEKEKQS